MLKLIYGYKLLLYMQGDFIWPAGNVLLYKLSLVDDTGVVLFTPGSYGS